MKKTHNLAIWAAISVVILTTATTIGLYGLREFGRQSHEGAIAHSALCAFKTDLQHRVDASRDFLTHHPEGFAGIPAATIRNSILNQQATLDSLAILHCRK